MVCRAKHAKKDSAVPFSSFFLLRRMVLIVPSLGQIGWFGWRGLRENNATKKSPREVRTMARLALLTYPTFTVYPRFGDRILDLQAGPLSSARRADGRGGGRV